MGDKAKAKQLWIKFFSLGIQYQERAEEYRASVTTREVGRVYSDDVARMAFFKARYYEQFI